jgi:competence protein ComEC
MPASATRAAGMFSIYIIGSIFKKRSHPLNILGGTGIIALASDPMIVYAVGFQLSYMALIGIVTVGLPLFRSVHFKNKILKYSWATVAISIGAQFLLLPVLAFYFNEISTMSIVSSLFAIPAAYVIVCSGILLVLTAYFISPVASWIGIALDKFIRLLTEGLQIISNISWSTIPKIYLTSTEVIILLILFASLSLRISTGQAFWSRLAIPAAISFLIIHSSTYAIRQNGMSITFYSTGSQPAFEIIHSGIAYHYGIQQLSEYALKNVRRNRLASYVTETQLLSIEPQFKNLIGFHTETATYSLSASQTPRKISIQ